MPGTLITGWNGAAIRWRGRESFQLAADLFRYQELIYARRPDIVVETGPGDGGTTTFLEDVCRAVGHGIVVGVRDSLASLPALRKLAAGQSLMAILDSDVYNYDHMLREIEGYAPLVTPGQVLVVCHTNREDWGAARALRAYLSAHEGEFATLPSPDATLNPESYLERIR